MLDTSDDERFRAELAQVAEARREHQHLTTQREAAAAEVGAASAEVDERRSALVQEHEDVVRLESVSLTRIVAGLKGERDDALRKEQAERETARLAFLAAEERLAGALRDLASVDDRLAALGDVDAAWDRVVDARERWILATSQRSGPPAGTAPAPSSGPDPVRVAAMAERRGVLEAEMREVDEALAAAHLAAARLALASSYLGSARSWSTYDTWFGGGMFSSMVKQDRLDEAASILRQADASLATLRRELADLSRSGVSSLTLDRWDRAFDTFLDNIFTDLAVDRRIRAAAEQVSRLRIEVDDLVGDLKARAVALADEAESLTLERRQLLG